MSDYLKKTWQNGIDPCNQTNMQHIEDGIAAVRGFYPIASYQVVSSGSISSSGTLTVTCTGVGGVSSGAKAVQVFGFFTPSASGMQLNFYPHGSTPASPQRIPPTTGSTDFQITAQLDATGKLDLFAASGSISNLNMWIDAYII